MSPRQTMSLGDTLLQLLFRLIVNTVSGAYLPRSYVGSDGFLRQHLLLLLLLLSSSSLLLQGKIVSVYDMKAYRGTSGTAPLLTPALD